MEIIETTAILNNILNYVSELKEDASQIRHEEMQVAVELVKKG